jgi:hypothetical protein
VTDVEEISPVGKGFYPIRGTRQEFISEDSWNNERMLQQIVGEIPSNPDSLLGWRKSWRVSEVEPNFELDDNAILLEFPVGTVYHNEETGKWFRTGTPERVFNLEISKLKAERMGIGESGETESTPLIGVTRSIGGLAVMNVVLLLLLGAGVAYAKHKGRIAK